MASQKEYTMLFALNASMNSGFQQTFGKATSTVQEMQKKIQALAKEQSDITAYEKQQKAVDATKSKLDVLKQQYDNIQKEIQETGTYSSALENKLLAKQQQIDKTSASLENQTGKLNQMGEALQESGVDTGHLTEESKRLETEMKDLQKEQEKAADEAKNFGDSTAKAFQAASEAIIAAGLVKALKAVASAYGECVKVSANFEQAMSQVAATMGVSKEEVTELGEFAKKMGAETSFSAVEAAEGLNILAMSGLSAKEQIAALPQVLSLAAAGAMDLQTASSLVTASVKGFSDTMDNAGYYADLMAKGATMANTDVRGLGTALSSSSATASSYGQAADSLTLSLLRLAEQNITGEEASTKLNRAMADLYTPTKDAKAALEELGVSAYTSTGDAKDFNDVVDELSSALANMSQEEANTYKNTIFTTNGLNAFNKMTVASTETVQKFWKGIGESSGSAAKQAGTQLDNLNGAMTIMNSAAEGLKITLGDEFSDELTGLVEIGTEILGNINDFVKKNPGLVKGLVTFVGTIGTVTTAITAASAAIKIFKAVSAMMIPGVGPILAATTAIAGLTAGVIALNEASSTPSLSELTEEANDLEKSIKTADSAFAETMSTVKANAQVANMYVDELQKMREEGLQTQEQQKEYTNVCKLLVDIMPELADQIGDVTEGWVANEKAIRDEIKAYEESAKQKAQQEYINALQEEYNDVLVEQYKNEVKLTEAKIKLEKAQEANNKVFEDYDNDIRQAQKAAEEYNKEYLASATYEQFLTKTTDEWTRAIEDSNRELWACEDAVDVVNKAIEKDADAVSRAKNAMAGAEEAVARMNPVQKEATEAVVDHTAAIDAMNGYIDTAYTSLEDLAEAYEDAYEAAKQSIEGQYNLWDDVEKVVAVSADSMSKKMEAQTKYWQDYNANLSSLRDRAGDIEGLSSILSSFADGSSESVNAVAGMAKASDEDLKAMVENYKSLQTAQNDTTENLADLKTNFEDNLGQIVESANENIRKLEQSDEAKKAAEDTINAYISGIEVNLPEVTKAYGKVQSAIQSGLRGASLKSGTKDPTPKGYATGTNYAEPGLKLVGENGPELVAFGGGEKVLNASKTERLLDGSSGGGNNIQISFNIAGGASDDTVSRLNEYAEDFADRVLAVINDAETDAKRRAYA